MASRLSSVDRKKVHLKLVNGDPTALAGAIPRPVDSSAPNRETLSRLYGLNPYQDFDLEAHPEDLQGWNSYDNVFRDAIEIIQPRRIVEVGVWKGVASIHMAEIVRELGLACEVICVDTWLGSIEHILSEHSDADFESLRTRNGYPQLYFTFLSNVIRHDAADHVVPLAMTSESAVVVLERLGLQADLIHIDAAHEYEPAARDFKAYWRVLSARGLLIGDDYQVKRGVTRAAEEFAKAVERPLCPLFPKFVIAKAAELEFASAKG